MSDLCLHWQLWDMAGQESINNVVIRNTAVCMLVLDLTSRRSLEDLSEWRDQFLCVRVPKDPDTFPFVVVGEAHT